MGKSKKQKAKPADNRRFIFIALGIMAIIAMVFTVKGILGGSESANSSQNQVTAQQDGNIQVINMKVSAAGYSPNNIVVNKGVPVKIITDSTEDAGCVRGFMLPGLGINQALKVGKDEIQFTPTEAGELPFSCQMKMSTGTIKVI